jgi:hypothetical protein
MFVPVVEVLSSIECIAPTADTPSSHTLLSSQCRNTMLSSPEDYPQHNATPTPRLSPTPRRHSRQCALHHPTTLHIPRISTPNSYNRPVPLYTWRLSSALPIRILPRHDLVVARTGDGNSPSKTVTCGGGYAYLVHPPVMHPL